MSILDNNNNQPIIPSPEMIARNLKNTAKQTFNSMVTSFNNGTRAFWNNPRANPTEIAEALGTDAKELFQLHYALSQLIISIKPEAINESLNLIGQFTMNEDGTVTIVSTSGNP